MGEKTVGRFLHQGKRRRQDLVQGLLYPGDDGLLQFVDLLIELLTVLDLHLFGFLPEGGHLLLLLPDTLPDQCLQTPALLPELIIGKGKDPFVLLFNG